MLDGPMVEDGRQKDTKEVKFVLLLMLHSLVTDINPSMRTVPSGLGKFKGK